MRGMHKHPLDALTDWILRDAATRPECREYDFTEVDHLCRRYLRRTELIAKAPPELLDAADHHACGLLRYQPKGTQRQDARH